jgi:putative MFS transporter
VLVFMIRYWVPESPRWLIRKGRHEEARKSLAWRSSCGQSAAPANWPVLRSRQCSLTHSSR